MTLENSITLPVQIRSEQLFEKRTVAELTEDQMMAVDGGTSIVTLFGTTSLVTLRVV